MLIANLSPSSDFNEPVREMLLIFIVVVEQCRSCPPVEKFLDHAKSFSLQESEVSG